MTETVATETSRIGNKNWIATLTATASLAGRPTTTGTNSAKHVKAANGVSATTGESTTTPIVTVTTTATNAEFEVTYPCSIARGPDRKENGPPVDGRPVVTSCSLHAWLEALPLKCPA